MKCTRCGSYAINHHSHGRNQDDLPLCDVCYWRQIAEVRLGYIKQLEEQCDETKSKYALLVADVVHNEDVEHKNKQLNARINKLEKDLNEAYAEMRKQLPCITAIFHRSPWIKANKANKVKKDEL